MGSAALIALMKTVANDTALALFIVCGGLGQFRVIAIPTLGRRQPAAAGGQLEARSDGVLQLQSIRFTVRGVCNAAEADSSCPVVSRVEQEVLVVGAQLQAVPEVPSAA